MWCKPVLTRLRHGLYYGAKNRKKTGRKKEIFRKFCGMIWGLTTTGEPT
jgi:hypothetical protein